MTEVDLLMLVIVFLVFLLSMSTFTPEPYYERKSMNHCQTKQLKHLFEPRPDISLNLTKLFKSIILKSHIKEKQTNGLPSATHQKALCHVHVSTTHVLFCLTFHLPELCYYLYVDIASFQKINVKLSKIILCKTS